MMNRSQAFPSLGTLLALGVLSFTFPYQDSVHSVFHASSSQALLNSLSGRVVRTQDRAGAPRLNCRIPTYCTSRLIKGGKPHIVLLSKEAETVMLSQVFISTLPHPQTETVIPSEVISSAPPPHPHPSPTPPPSPEEFRSIIVEAQEQFLDSLNRDRLNRISAGDKIYFLRGSVEAAIRNIRSDLSSKFEAKELAALRDFVAKESRGLLHASEMGLLEGIRNDGFVTASYRIDADWLSEEQLAWIVKKGKELFDRLYHASDHLTVSVCVATYPSQANFKFYPLSDKKGARTFSTIGLKKDVWIGTYGYVIDKEGFESIVNDDGIDFVDDSMTILECQLVAEGKKAIACRPGSMEVREQCLRRQ